MSVSDLSGRVINVVYLYCSPRQSACEVYTQLWGKKTMEAKGRGRRGKNEGKMDGKSVEIETERKGERKGE